MRIKNGVVGAIVITGFFTTSSIFAKAPSQWSRIDCPKLKIIDLLQDEEMSDGFSATTSAFYSSIFYHKGETQERKVTSTWSAYTPTSNWFTSNPNPTRILLKKIHTLWKISGMEAEQISEAFTIKLQPSKSGEENAATHIVRPGIFLHSLHEVCTYSYTVSDISGIDFAELPTSGELIFATPHESAFSWGQYSEDGN